MADVRTPELMSLKQRVMCCGERGLENTGCIASNPSDQGKEMNIVIKDLRCMTVDATPRCCGEWVG
ncbi:hypothetical protein E2C01_022006 [Portunus trituberculatus]|uniref:Uncharacterized protein n=1 Tax=Portunus trituberculatus TaxID=210409 RepID=A0A5B7E646_PORTR|nr:hypothetical protein [Portunus trituberculatus]